MADKDYKVFIVEGEVRESQIIDNIFSHGFTFLTGEFTSFMENLVKYKNIVELGKLGKMRHFYL